MIAKYIPSILPPMTFDEAVETTKIWSAAGHAFNGVLVRSRAFRSPYHTSSAAALAGGGVYPKQGEVSLSHNGVLFLDEFVEFRRDALEVLRQPLEDKVITISRARNSFTFPSIVYACSGNESLPMRQFRTQRKRMCLQSESNKKISEQSFWSINGQNRYSH
jgi:magnesium chelatase family protein